MATLGLSQTHPKTRPVLRRLIWRIVQIASIVILPFFVLVRTGTWLYQSRGVPTWLAFLGAALLTLGVLTWYGAWISRSWTGKRRIRFVATRIALPVVVAYCGYTLLYLAKENAKTDAVREYYTSLHPLFRLALGTLLLADRDLVVTDVRRTPADYRRMGLPVKEASLHYRQEGGYVHAVDLRTIGRPAWRTGLLTAYFRIMGFRTLRHGGTADHLHVSLPPH